MTIRNLAVVQPGDETKPPHMVRRQIGKTLRVAASIAEGGTGYTLGKVEHTPIRAAVLVLFSADGEPAPIAIGFDGVSPDTSQELLRDANSALDCVLAQREWRDGSLAARFEERTGDKATTRSQLARTDWLNRSDTRKRNAETNAAKEAAHEAEFPILCDCGQRLRTLRGMAQHERGRRHRSWLERSAR